MGELMSTLGTGLFSTTANNDIPNVNVASATSSTVATNDNYVILQSATGGARNVTLPAATGNVGKVFVIKKTDSSANAVTVVATIDGVANYLLLFQNDTITVVSNGTDYSLIDSQITPIVIVASKNAGNVGAGATIATWTTVIQNYNSTFNATTGVFTNPRVGAKFNVFASQGGDNAASNIGIQKNATILHYGAAGARADVPLTVIADPTDTIFAIASLAINFNADDESTYLCISEIR